jgi:protein-glucosylgalactosylhydroxylysine glucosidase
MMAAGRSGKKRAGSSAPLNPLPIAGGGLAELPAYVSNGLIGLRVREISVDSGIAILTGYSGQHPVEKIEAAARIPYPVEGKIRVNGVELSDAPFCVHDVEQRYDFSTAELSSKFIFAADGVNVEVETVTFCSRTWPTLVCQQIEVKANGRCELVLGAGLDTRAIDGRAVRTRKDTGDVDGILRWESAGGVSTCGLAYTTDFKGARSKRSLAERDDQLTTLYDVKMKSGDHVRLRQITSVVPSVLHQQPDLQSARLVAMGHELGWDVIRADNQAEWQQLWKSRIRLIGADRYWQQLADAAFFYLNTSVHASSPASTAIFGLAAWKDYHYYYGHVMWDLETFAVPVLTLLQPSAAVAMLQYRYEGAEAARKTARMVGRSGMQCPWQSASSSAEEAAPLPGTASWHEDHVSLDVALAFAFYCDVTGDRRFLSEKAWPILCGVADWIESRVTKTARGYEIRRSMGIAERKKPSDNTAFTNMSAKQVLRKAVQVGKALNMPGHDHWSEIAEGIVVAKRRGIVISHDGYRANEEKGATPDPLMGIFPLWFDLSPEEEKKTLKFYLDRADNYLGSPMLSALYGAWAAWSGDRRLSLRLLKEGYGDFVTGRFLQTLEYRPDRFPEQPMAGPFFANLGGFLLTLLLGFPAIRPDAGPIEDWPRRKVVLPAGWKAIQVDRLYLRGREVSLLARHSAPKAVLNSSES